MNTKQGFSGTAVAMISVGIAALTLLISIIGNSFVFGQEVMRAGETAKNNATNIGLLREENETTESRLSTLSRQMGRLEGKVDMLLLKAGISPES